MRKILLFIFLLAGTAFAQEEICFSGCVKYGTQVPHPSLEPTPIPTPSTSPTSSPSLTPTSSPSPEPSASPIPSQSSSPSISPTPTPSSSPEPVPSPSPSPFVKPIPGLSAWEQRMLQFGLRWCSYYDETHTFDEYLLATYYDAEAVFYKILDYTGDSSWGNCAQKAEAIYRDQYAVKFNGAVPGYWSFTHGVYRDYVETQDAGSKAAVILISQNAMYHANFTPPSAMQDFELSRENAYALMAHLNEERLGEPHRSRVEGLVDNAISHIDQWSIAKTADYVKPFMVGLTARALIEYYEFVPDPRIPSSLIAAADDLWARFWLPADGSFTYISETVGNEHPGPAPDLNLLIAPMYAWLYKHTGDLRFRERGDQVFENGAVKAWLGHPKHFNQNYTWSFDYVVWRTPQ